MNDNKPTPPSVILSAEARKQVTEASVDAAFKRLDEVIGWHCHAVGSVVLRNAVKDVWAALEASRIAPEGLSDQQVRDLMNMARKWAAPDVDERTDELELALRGVRVSQSAQHPLAVLASQQQPLGREFEKVLHDNAEALYSRDDPPAQAVPAPDHIVDANKMVPASFDEKALEVARRFTLDTEPQRRASLQCAVIEAMRWAVPPARAGGVPPGEWGGLSPKQAWWAGYRVGKGLPPDMPRSEAVAAEAVPAQAEMTDAEIDKHWGEITPQGDPSGRKFARAFARAILSARKDRGDALLLKVYQQMELLMADSDIIDEVRDYLEGK